MCLSMFHYHLFWLFFYLMVLKTSIDTYTHLHHDCAIVYKIETVAFWTLTYLNNLMNVTEENIQIRVDIKKNGHFLFEI